MRKTAQTIVQNISILKGKEFAQAATSISMKLGPQRHLCCATAIINESGLITSFLRYDLNQLANIFPDLVPHDSSPSRFLVKITAIISFSTVPPSSPFFDVSDPDRLLPDVRFSFEESKNAVERDPRFGSLPPSLVYILNATISEANAFSETLLVENEHFHTLSSRLFDSFTSSDSFPAPSFLLPDILQPFVRSRPFPINPELSSSF